MLAQNQRVKTTIEFLVNTVLRRIHKADVAIHLTKYRVFLSKPIFCHFKEFLCTSLSTSWIGKSWNVCSKRLLICYCAIAACVFFKPTSAEVLRFSTNADSVFKVGGKWSEMENSSKSVASLCVHYSPPLSRTLKPNSTQIFQTAQLMTGKSEQQ